MDPVKLIALLQQLAAFGATIADLVEDARDNLSSDDEAKLKGALADLEERNNTSYQRIRAKLANAAAAD